MAVLSVSRCLAVFLAAVSFALASTNPETENLELKLHQIRPVQKIIPIDFGKLGDLLRANPKKGEEEGDPANSNDPEGPIWCPRGANGANGCVSFGPRKPLARESYVQLSAIAGIPCNKDAPLCPIGQCADGCLCREEIYTRLRIVLLNDAFGELSKREEEAKAKDEL
ncbi:hypothetical protein QBC39DRAFT_357102 [Podospora conica]|nr:hypothetical protein QBC39DRAFT_357102 [Schizothecium conicum]